MHYRAHTQEAYLVLLPYWNCKLIARLEEILLILKNSNFISENKHQKVELHLVD